MGHTLGAPWAPQWPRRYTRRAAAHSSRAIGAAELALRHRYPILGLARAVGRRRPSAADGRALRSRRKLPLGPIGRAALRVVPRRPLPIQRLIAGPILLLAACAVPGPAAFAQALPRLAVVVIVDQMRFSYLDEFAGDFEGGFARLLREGAVYENAYHDHALTETAPGHATIVSGVYPARHGVVGNDIWSRRSRTLRGAVLDPQSAMVGAERRFGRSPRMLERTTVGDWLRARSPSSKVFAVSLKDRAAVFSAGMRPSGAFWYDERTGYFVTSDYYRDSLPAWLRAFNEAGHVEGYFGATWTMLWPAEHYARPAPELSGAERAVIYSEFPHALVGDSGMPDRRFYTRFRLTPFADRMTLDLAEALIEAEDLGGDDDPDLLLVGLSASDYIGHRYGPWSAEIHDHYARLDRYLGEFLAYLDRRLGTRRSIVVLSADHGGMPVPERLAEQGIPAARLHWDALLTAIAPVVAEAHTRGVIPAVPDLRYEFGVIFDFGGVSVSRHDSDMLARLVAAELERHPLVEAAYTHAQLRKADPDGAGPLGRFARSFVAGRSPDVVLRIRENYLVTDRRRGTTHVSPHDYDRHVPLVFWGPGIPAGVHARPVRSVDIAPTLAAMLGVPAPGDLDGTDLAPRSAGGD